LRNDYVDTPAVIGAHFRRYTLLESFQAGTHLEWRREPQAKPSCQCRTQFPSARLANHSQHLQFGPCETLSLELLRVERVEVLPGANDRLVHAPLFARCPQLREFDREHGRTEPDFDPIALAEESRQIREHLPGVDGQFQRAIDCPTKPFWTQRITAFAGALR